MRPFLVSTVLLSACTTHVKFDDILVDADVDDIDVDGDSTGTTDPTDTTTTGDTDPSLAIEQVHVGCEAYVSFTVEARGLPTRGRVYEIETGNVPTWGENHDLVIPYDGRLELDLFPVDRVQDQVSSETTLFGCEYVDLADILTVLLQIESEDGLTDCVAFGHDPAGLLAGDYDDDMMVPPEPGYDDCRVLDSL